MLNPPRYKGRASSVLLKIGKWRKKLWIYREVLNHRTTVTGAS
ncbi:AAA+-type ATPase [Pseudomonas syringae pv. actinidiae]|uniref:AAA+-type ATPase n=1 Tax=Pseudomonas syringae pv. actinidiae TaxID=103796 RepID=A0AAN4Q6T3_PSESF|nr:AAA+-type ATPase [Pseudomonas syringae pv. actinidiae]